MANVFFKKGLRANLPASYSAGTFYVTTDERAMYLDVDGSTRIRLGDFQEFPTLAALKANVNPSTTAMYYVADLNVLAKWNGTEYVQINPDTGVTSVEVVGEGNAVTAASYDPTTRKLTLTKGETFATKSEFDALDAYVGDIPEGYTESNVVAYINKKAQEVLSQATGGSSESAASVKAALEAYVAENDPKVTANTNAIAAIKDGTSVDSFADVEVELDKKVDKVEGKSLVSDAEITKLAGVSTGANKVEASTNNGSIKIDGVETVVYTHPDKHALSDVDGLVDALEGKQAKGDYATKAEAQGYADAKDEAIAAAQKAGDDAQDAVDALAAKVGEVPADKTVIGMIAEAQEAATYDDTELAGRVSNLETASATHALKTEVQAVQDDLDGYKESNDAALAGVKATADAAAVQADVDAALALKADKSEFDEVKATVDNFFAEDAAVNDVIDTLKEITTYIANDKEGAADITARVGALEGKVDVAKVSEAISAAVKVESDRAVAAEEALDGRLDALEAIDHDAYKAADTVLKGEIVGTSGDASSADTIYGAKKYAEEKATAAQNAAATDAQNKVDALANGQVKTNTEEIAKKANSADVYAKTETYTKSEVDALLESATQWGSF